MENSAVNTEVSPFGELIDRLLSREEKLSFSSFNQFCFSPRHFIAYKLRQVEQTRAMLEGEVLHCAVLEPDELEERYAIQTLPDPSSKNQQAMAALILEGAHPSDAYAASYACKGKSAEKIAQEAAAIAEQLAPYVDFLATAGDRKIIPQDMADFARTASDHLWKNESSRYVLENLGETEKPVEWEFGGFQWRGYIDGIGPSMRMDLKLVPDALPRKARQRIEQERYHWQVGNFYGLPAGCGGDREAYIIAIDRDYHISVHRIRKAVIEQQWEDINYRMRAFKRCIFMDEWGKSFDFWQDIYEI